EFGAIGPDAALLDGGEAGASFAEGAGGCLRCATGVPFHEALTRRPRPSGPQRLGIEPSSPRHPAAPPHQPRTAAWRGVLAPQRLVLVLDAEALAAGAPLPESQQAVIGEAGLLVLNKSAGLDEAQRAQLAARWPESKRVWTEQGRLALADLPQAPLTAAPATPLPEPAAIPAGTLWSDPAQPLCEVREAPEGWSIGWRWHPGQCFDLPR